MPAPVTIYHNPSCGSSKNALAIADELGVEYTIVEYLKKAQRPSRETLEWLVARLEGPVADLVRKDAEFERLGLAADDYTTPSAVVDVLVEHPSLLQRPLLVKGDRVVIGRPKERVRELLGG